MKKTIYLCPLVAIVTFVAGFIVCQNTKVKRQSIIINAYDSYYRHTEQFLDTLEKYDNWVDRFDPYDYYESSSKLDSLLYNK